MKIQGLCEDAGLVDTARSAAIPVDLLEQHHVWRQVRQHPCHLVEAQLTVSDVVSHQSHSPLHDALERVEIILHRPQSSENVGAVARAMKNFGLSRLVLVDPPRLDMDRARALAVDAHDLLESARIEPTLDAAIAPLVLVIPTTERVLDGRAAPLLPGEAARVLVERTTEAGHKARVGLLFGEEATGLRLSILARFPHYSSIPSDRRKRSLNLAQAVLLYAWELEQAAGRAEFDKAPRPRRHSEPAPRLLIDLLRTRSRELLLATGFLNPAAPDHILDELMRLLQRASPTRRELELLLAALAQLERTSTVLGKDRK